MRPHSIGIVDGESAKIPAEVKLVEHIGDSTILKAQLASGEAVLVIVPGDAELRPGERIGLNFDEANAYLFETTGSRLVRSGTV